MVILGRCQINVHEVSQVEEREDGMMKVVWMEQGEIVCDDGAVSSRDGGGLKESWVW